MRYDEYVVARNLSWQILIERKITTLPINISRLCLDYQAIPLNYRRASQILTTYGLIDNCIENDGFALKMRGSCFILFNDQCTPGRVRFTMAHELGHILLGHMFRPADSISYTVRNREPAPGDDPIEQQANVFASRLLAPACILDALHIEDADELSTLCGLSRTSALFRMQRMQKLKKRRKLGITFQQNELERAVLRQFRPFIRWYRKREPSQRLEQMKISRDGHIIGTTLALVDQNFPEVMVFPPNVQINAQDILIPYEKSN